MIAVLAGRYCQYCKEAVSDTAVPSSSTACASPSSDTFACFGAPTVGLPSQPQRVCFYRWLQKLLLWPAVIPDHKSQTPMAKSGWMRQQIRSIKQDILHSISPAVQARPQSVHSSLLLLSAVCRLLLDAHNTEGGLWAGRGSGSRRASSVDSVARLRSWSESPHLCSRLMLWIAQKALWKVEVEVECWERCWYMQHAHMTFNL